MKNCMLFKKGNTHKFKGQDCEVVVVSPSQIDQYLGMGWFKSIDEAEADKNDSGKLSNEEIRLAAREAGIDNWETGRIKGLKEALGYENS